MAERTGACLCGAIRFRAENPSELVGACHCDMCRKWGGGPFMEIDCGSEVVFEGEHNITVYDSSEWADRGFCSRCGSHLFYRLKDARQYMMPVGLFDDQAGLVFDHQVFIDEKPAFYSFSNKTTDMTAAEIWAKYGPPPQ
jgi:hypothetical protein